MQHWTEPKVFFTQEKRQEEFGPNLRDMSALSLDLSDYEDGDVVPLITPQKAAMLGATNIMATWTSQLTKLLTSGLVAVIITLTFIAMYQLRSTYALDYSRHNIILVDATEQITAERACVAESIARQYRDVPCYLYLTSNPTLALQILSDTYPNLYLRRWSWSPNIKDTPMEPLLKNVGVVWLKLLRSQSKIQELTARAVTLWKYGGTTLSLDWQMVDGEGCLGVERLPYNRVDAHAMAFLRLETCHVLMEKLLVEIRRELEGGRKFDAEKLFAQVLRQLCPSTKELKEEPDLCHGMQVYNGTLRCAAPLPGDWRDTNSVNCPLIKSGNFKSEYVNVNVVLPSI